MGYGGFGIPHHKVSDRGDDPETDFGMIEGDVTGWDIGCRTMGFYVNSLAKGGDKERGLGKGKRVSGVGTIGAKKNPVGVRLRGLAGNLVDQLPAKALRINRRVNNRQRARYPITRKRGFTV